MNNSTIVKLAGLMGIVAGVFGVSAVLTATFLAGTGFSWSRNALSDLGVSQVADVANLFNYSLVIAGVLNFIFAIGFVKAHAKSTLFYLGSLLLVLGGWPLSLVGVFTDNCGSLHDYVSFAYFVLFPLAMILIGAAFLKMNMLVKAYASVLLGVFSLIVILGGIAVKWHGWLSLGFAVPEIIEAVIIAAWTVRLAASLTR